MTRYIGISIIFVISCAVAIVAQTSNQARCLQFTWLGPRWTNESSYQNATCDAVTNLAQGIPCFKPLVASEDGTWPDIPYIWHNHGDEASCTVTDSDVCASFTYSFNGHVENATFMCTRAVDINGVAINSGCYEQRNGSFASRVCFCRPTAGGMPCNSAVSTFACASLTLIMLIHLFIKKILYR